MDSQQLETQIEGLLFAAGRPLTLRDIKRVLMRLWGELNEEEAAARDLALRAAMTALETRWGMIDESAEQPALLVDEAVELPARGFRLYRIAGGYTFRTCPDVANVLQAMREEKPVRLSRPALETLAIVAYRQPITKPEADQIRGVDCGGTLKLLLDRQLVRIVGKKEEPGRPLLYGTTHEFLSLFNLSSLRDLPSLRDFKEIARDAEVALNRFEGLPSLRELSESAAQLRESESEPVEALDEALSQLKQTERQAQDALQEEGVALGEADDEPAPPASAA